MSIRIKRVEMPPSGIKRDDRTELVLESGEVVIAAVAMAVFGLVLLGMVYYGGQHPGFYPSDAPKWLPAALSALGVFLVWGAIRAAVSRQRLAVDFSTRRLLRYENGGLRETIPLSDFTTIQAEFKKAVFSDDSDTWTLRLIRRNGEPLPLFATSSEEKAFRVWRRMRTEGGLPGFDPQRLFPSEDETDVEEGNAVSEQGFPTEVLQREPPPGMIRLFLDRPTPQIEMAIAKPGCGTLFFAGFSFTWTVLALVGSFSGIVIKHSSG